MRVTLYFVSLCLYKNMVTNRHQFVRDCNALNITISGSLISYSDLFYTKSSHVDAINLKYCSK